MMKIAALTIMYNEALILPHFLKHYEYLDEIHVLYETDSTDESLNMLSNAPNVIIKEVHIKDGLDDIDKVNLINNTMGNIRADWVYILDSDEFIFPPYESPCDFLKRQDYDVVRAVMFQVYRHRTDRDLDSSLPPVPQRIHGDLDVFSRIEKPNRDRNAHYIKPIVVRASTGIRFLPGNHIVEGNFRISPELYYGAHWQMADPSLALDRRLKNRARMSERNKAGNMGWQHYNVTEEWIRTECNSHLDDPVIEALCPAGEKSPEEINTLLKKSLIQESVIFDLTTRIDGLDQQLQQVKNENLEITGSRAWRLVMTIRRFADTVLPLNSRRRLFAGKVINLFTRN